MSPENGRTDIEKSPGSYLSAEFAGTLLGASVYCAIVCGVLPPADFADTDV